ncbi:hypothetical protein AUEXF2481DRAFT_705633 [Aureobasidium subglaciale EXF-2481]|uniref:Uncharacterized protein n=1 Tax=Aureobasidium subglaciale (strain EXF-2481) TaxID=1043005 RepID=A0A074XX60_AURSE|nr:uncharacterized protein AUEXF2481DRAFT_705633 [Aureobasidium subglaciale EXF-2481]KEQ90143.1 hypothetical protein AUEXF2481DRAFT_705633 [Aureobasidium subglaciale EXF-2481]
MDFTSLYYTFFNLTKDRDISSILEELSIKDKELNLELESISSYNSSSSLKASKELVSKTSIESSSTKDLSTIYNSSIVLSSPILNSRPSSNNSILDLEPISISSTSSSSPYNSSIESPSTRLLNPKDVFSKPRSKVFNINSPSTSLTKLNLKRLEKETTISPRVNLEPYFNTLSSNIRDNIALSSNNSLESTTISKITKDNTSKPSFKSASLNSIDSNRNKTSLSLEDIYNIEIPTLEDNIYKVIENNPTSSKPSSKASSSKSSSKASSPKVKDNISKKRTRGRPKKVKTRGRPRKEYKYKD